MSEQQIASALRGLVERAYNRVDDVDSIAATVVNNGAALLGGVLETAKQVLVEADKALAEYEKTEEVKLGADLADETRHEYATETEMSVEEKLTAITNAADDNFGKDGHVWWLVEVNDQNRQAIVDAYDKLQNGTLFDVDNF